jgi:hypothetical protein
LDLRLHGLDQLDDELHLARDKPGERGGCRAIGHVLNVKAGELLHILGGEVLGRADAGTAEIELARIGLGLRDELLEVLGREARRRHQNEAGSPNHRHHLKIGNRIVAQGLIDRSRDRVRVAHHQRGVAVLGGARDPFRRRRSAAAHSILDYDGLAEQLRERLRHDARRDVGTATGAEADHDADRLARPVLRLES